MDNSALISIGLARYVKAVAEEIGVPPEGTEFEVSDTATAYLGLEGPGPDLMLLWNEKRGWSIAVETDPTEAPLVIAHLGMPLVPPPDAVARFVDDVLAGKPGSPEPEFGVTHDRNRLATRLSDYL
ncbi:hypothetical protein ALI22I_32115 [Saccharothrix sp. ALI-22-I]|uniref:DUF6292 family protein n=1 Tax=Saccharothrix sp. ALI-22-I TaxID=1933778 RepID=UPI00097BCBE1|nr:DUF6292 family protein [Saccharothrix sp. ALI-22-I]ONI85078.1 hypothetical protein ALI22I_32115 [Saccharothrix sp. ALI-22-I]